MTGKLPETTSKAEGSKGNTIQISRSLVIQPVSWGFKFELSPGIVLYYSQWAYSFVAVYISWLDWG